MWSSNIAKISQIKDLILGGYQDGDQPESQILGRLCPRHSQLSLNSSDEFLTCLKKRKTKNIKKFATHVDLQEALWALWHGTATGPNVPLPCHETWSTHPLTGSPGGHPQCCHLQCLLSYQDSPASGLTTALTDSTGWRWLWRGHLDAHCWVQIIFRHDQENELGSSGSITCISSDLAHLSR